MLSQRHQNASLECPSYLLEQFSCESQQASTAIARGVARIIPSNISVGITGLASLGASESESKPVGTVFISIIFNSQVYEKALQLTGDRAEIRRKASLQTFEFLYEILISTIVHST